jgi:Rad52/22 family double-strand break repair protein
MARLTAEQVKVLLQPVKAERVLMAKGQAHLPAYDVAAHLTRILGFAGWDTEITGLTMLFEDGGTEGKRWTVGYSCTLKLMIKNADGEVIAQWENGAAGDAVNQPSRADAHHLAMTTAISTALKRCAAFGLGDQFGLSLYNKGKVFALISKTLVMPEGDGEVADLESHIPAPESMGNDESEGQVDYLADLAAMLGASGLTQEERKVFIEDAVGRKVPKFSDLSQDEAKVAGAKLRAAILAGNEEPDGQPV